MRCNRVAWQVHNKAERARKRGGDDSQSGGSRDSIQEPSLDLHSLENEVFVPGLNPSGVRDSGSFGGSGEVEQGSSRPGGHGSGPSGVDQEGNVDDRAVGDWRDAGAWALVADEVRVASTVVPVDTCKLQIRSATNSRSMNRRLRK